jgi:RimJ/RimL family protein N-acetyltransferase
MQRDLVALHQKWDTDFGINRTTSVARPVTLEEEAEYGIVIGEPDCQGRGYGTETTSLMLDYAFTVLGLHNVMLTVMAYNLAGIRTYEKAGFRQWAGAGRLNGCETGCGMSFTWIARPESLKARIWAVSLCRMSRRVGSTQGRERSP